MKPKKPAAEPTPPPVLAEAYRRALVETARRCLAMRRQFPGCLVRWRRAAKTGPNSALALVAVAAPGQFPAVEVWPYCRVEELAAAVSDADTLAELHRHGGTPGEANE